MLTTDTYDGVLVMTLDRPEARNAVTGETVRQIAAALDQLDADDELRVGILTGAGGTFCSGLDLKAFLTGDKPYVDGRGFGGMVEYASRKPLIAAIEGFAVGGGFEMALACDLIVCARGAKLGLPEVRRGRLAGGGGLLRLPERIPFHIASEMAMTGELISGERAYELGLANRLVEDGRALEVARELADTIAANAPLAVLGSKQILAGAREWPAAEGFARQKPIADAVRGSVDAQEGARAFKEKRPPVWQSR